MKTILEENADGNTPTQRCLAALAPVVRGLVVDNIPADLVISTVTKLTLLSSDANATH